MRIIVLIVFAVAFCLKINAQTAVTVYDSTLAKKLGADDYGMKSYIFVLLKSGTNNLEQGPERDSIFHGHINNIGRLADLGKLVIAGPFGENDKSWRGIFILNVKTTAEAQRLLETDPAIKAKLLSAEMYEWFGSAAIEEYLKIQDKIMKKHY